MTRMEAMVMLAEGGLKERFEDADKSFEIINGELPGAYFIPQWLWDAMQIFQEDKPKWRGKQLDPWAKDVIRGQ